MIIPEVATPTPREFKDGERIRLRAIKHLDIDINATIRRVPSEQRLTPATQSNVNPLTVDCPLDPSIRTDLAREFEGLGKDHQEIWHQNYGELDSGNIVDASGAASRVLDKLASVIGWELRGPRFDKIMLRKYDERRLSAFHTDHLVCRPSRSRAKGRVERIIFNLGIAPRWFAVLDIPKVVVSRCIGDPYCDSDYLQLLSSCRECQILLYETPPAGPDGRLHGLRFDAFSTVHCGYGAQGDMAAVISRWIPRRTFQPLSDPPQ